MSTIDAHSHVGMCLATGKRRYLTIRAARKANKHNPQRIRVYRCEVCHNLHVTKEPIQWNA